jgi:putative Holliday junction resolvase
MRREQLFQEIRNLIRRMDVEKIVVGYPLTLQGDEGPMAREVKHFVKTLKQRTGLPVVLWDERLSSVQAKRVLRSSGLKADRNKDHVDRIASSLILQNYLDHRNTFSEDPNREVT